jgi:glycine cleavage system H protein
MCKLNKEAGMAQKDLLYTRSHEWTRIEGNLAVVGISGFAQEQLGDITFVDLPPIGTTVRQGEEMGSIESVKAASELYSPVTGEVTETNGELADAPERINADPYGGGWLVKVKIDQAPSGLMNSEEYETYTAGLSH